MNVPSFKIDLLAAVRERALHNTADVLTSGMFASHKYTALCRDKITELMDVHVSMTNSGSSALESCAYVMKEFYGLGKVLVPANTFCATALAFERIGFELQFYRNGIYSVGLDIPDGYDGLVIVELGGEIPHDIEAIVEAAHNKGMWVVEDACQAFGSVLGNKMAGTFGDMAAYSFFATKVLTAGEGGAVLAQESRFHEAANLYRDFGKLDPWTSYHVGKGWNCRMNEFGAAVLEAQLHYLPEILANRELIREYYRSELDNEADLWFPEEPLEPHEFNGYKVIAFVAGDRNAFIKHCESHGVKLQGNVYDYILPEQPIYQSTSMVGYDWTYDWKQMICLPTWYGMQRQELDYVIDVVRKGL